MRLPISRVILEKMLVGEALDESDLRKLAAVETEDLHLEFKDGKELDNKTEAPKTLRQYISGFANSDGGLLIFGVANDKKGGSRPFTPTKRPGGQALNEWATRSLLPLAGQLSPSPRIQVITVEKCEVLVVGIGRAPSLLPCLEGGELKYYLRIGESTPSIPPYLITDLVLGRRNHPTLIVRPRSKGEFAVNGSGNRDSCLIGLGFEVENVGLLPASDIVVGVISWAHKPTDRKLGLIASDSLRQHLEIQHCEISNMVPVHVFSQAISSNKVHFSLGAFETGNALNFNELWLPRELTPIPVRSALYIVAHGHAPDWWQLDWEIPPRGHDSTPITLTRCWYERPVVAWKPKPDTE